MPLRHVGYIPLNKRGLLSMKKMLSGILVCLLILTCVCGSWAEDTEATGAEEANQPITYDYDELTVAVTTPMTGNFFTSPSGILRVGLITLRKYGLSLDTNNAK